MKATIKVLGIVLVSGKKEEWMPLVQDRCKAAVPFFGKYRIIDFVLSNCLNSGIRQIHVVVQHKFASLLKHIRDGWSLYSSHLGEYIDVYPPQQRRGEFFYEGTADSVYQNLFSIEEQNPDYVLTLSGDHLYQMDYRELLEFHRQKKAELTIASIPVPQEKAHQFGILHCDSDRRILDFQEKPKDIQQSSSGSIWASMGIYVFSTGFLKEIFYHAEQEKRIFQEFGRDMIPEQIKKGRVYSYPFVDSKGKARYWRTLNTIEEYYESNQDILKQACEINLWNKDWPFRTYQSQSSPTQILNNMDIPTDFSGIESSSVSGGGKIEGKVKNSILGTNVSIGKGAEVLDSILFENVQVLPNTKVSRAIVDKHTIIDQTLSPETVGNCKNSILRNNLVIVGKQSLDYGEFLE